jgi:hypothetical protein
MNASFGSILLLVLLCQMVHAQSLGTSRPRGPDVSALQHRVEECSRWRNERAYDEERLKEIRRNECHSCLNNDKTLASLKEAYSRDENALASLKALEERIDTTYQQQIDECRLLNALPKYHRSQDRCRTAPEA